MSIIKIGGLVVALGLFAKLGLGSVSDEIPALIENGALVIDVRTPGEFAGGAIAGAINISYDRIAGEIGRHESDKARTIIVYCHSGGRSAAAKKILEKAGYSHVINGRGFSRMRKLLRQLSSGSK